MAIRREARTEKSFGSGNGGKFLRFKIVNQNAEALRFELGHPAKNNFVAVGRPVDINLCRVFSKQRLRRSTRRGNDENRPRFPLFDVHVCDLVPVRRPAGQRGARWRKRELAHVGTIDAATPQRAFGNGNVRNPLPVGREIKVGGGSSGQERRVLAGGRIIFHHGPVKMQSQRPDFLVVWGKYRTPKRYGALRKLHGLLKSFFLESAGGFPHREKVPVAAKFVRRGLENVIAPIRRPTAAAFRGHFMPLRQQRMQTGTVAADFPNRRGILHRVPNAKTNARAIRGIPRIIRRAWHADQFFCRAARRRSDVQRRSFDQQHILPVRRPHRFLAVNISEPLCDTAAEWIGPERIFGAWPGAIFGGQHRSVRGGNVQQLRARKSEREIRYGASRRGNFGNKVMLSGNFREIQIRSIRSQIGFQQTVVRKLPRPSDTWRGKWATQPEQPGSNCSHSDNYGDERENIFSRHGGLRFDYVFEYAPVREGVKKRFLLFTNGLNIFGLMVTGKATNSWLTVTICGI